MPVIEPESKSKIAFYAYVSGTDKVSDQRTRYFQLEIRSFKSRRQTDNATYKT